MSATFPLAHLPTDTRTPSFSRSGAWSLLRAATRKIFSEKACLVVVDAAMERLPLDLLFFPLKRNRLTRPFWFSSTPAPPTILACTRAVSSPAECSGGVDRSILATDRLDAETLVQGDSTLARSMFERARGASQRCGAQAAARRRTVATPENKFLA